MPFLSHYRRPLFYTLLLLILSSHSSIPCYVESLGINYGQLGNDIPAPPRVLTLIRSLGLTKARIYDTNPTILSAFANSGVDLIVTVENEILSTMTNPAQALQWVSTRIRPYFPATNITGIAVGNEVLTDPAYSPYVVPAMVAIHSALAQLGLAPYISVSSPTSMAVMASSYPPSSGSFTPELAGVMSQFVGFLQRTGSPFWINAYPYFAYMDEPKTVSLDYVLFNVPNQGMVDPASGLKYDNMLYAMVDAVVYAINRMGYRGIEVKVSETGWPSNGDPGETGATLQNAAVYNRNLLRRQWRNEGTPLRPSTRLDVYVFALFNEDMKPGPTSERNYGLFHPDCTMSYNVGINSNNNLGTNSGGSATNSMSTLTSSASKDINKRSYRSMVYGVIVYLAGIHVLARRRP